MVVMALEAERLAVPRQGLVVRLFVRRLKPNPITPRTKDCPFATCQKQASDTAHRVALRNRIHPATFDVATK